MTDADWCKQNLGKTFTVKGDPDPDAIKDGVQVVLIGYCARASEPMLVIVSNKDHAYGHSGNATKYDVLDVSMYKAIDRKTHSCWWIPREALQEAAAQNVPTGSTRIVCENKLTAAIGPRVVSDYPHTCPGCKQPAYISPISGSVDCEQRCGVTNEFQKNGPAPKGWATA